MQDASPVRVSSDPEESYAFESMLVASRNDPYCSFETAQHLAEVWGSRLVDAGPLGHINADSGIGDWKDGLGLLETLIVADTNLSIRINREANQTHRARADAQGGPLEDGLQPARFAFNR